MATYDGRGAAGTSGGWRRAARVLVVTAALAATIGAALAASAGSSSAIGDLVMAATRTAPPPPAKPQAREPAGPQRDLHYSGWSIGGDESGTVIAFDMSGTVPVRVFGLAEPTRVVIELPSGRFDPPLTTTHGGSGLVAGWRFGEFAAGRSRLVLDTRAAVRIVKAEIETTPAGVGTRLVVVLAPGSREDMMRAAAIDVGPPRAPEPMTAEAHDDGTPAPKGDRRPIAAAKAVEPPSRSTARPVVVIDAGHGGVDAGTVSPATGTPEKSVVLEMSKVLARHLRDSGRYDVVMTRTEDAFLGLGERVKIARSSRADLFLSIHADAEYDHSVRGATVYTLAEKASDEQAAALAAKENQSDAIAGMAVEEAEAEVTGILAELTLRETRRFSHAFARDILAEYRRHGRLVKTQPHRQAGLRVLRAHDIPSALVEIGFLSNKEDEALMTSTEWRERTAASLVAAIDRYFGERDAIGTVKKDVGGRAPASP